jgi:hypothetical protein
MRSYGLRFECLRMRPHDHIGWVFAGQTQFEALARPFLAEGAALGEQLMYVVPDPDPGMVARLAGALGPRGVQIASIAEVYGSSGIVNALGQRATFASALADALAEGYSGIRVAADNTPLVTDEARLTAWLRWETTADRFMSENQVTGLCAFDRDKVDVNRLRHLATLHPLSPSIGPVPQYRLFSDMGNLCIEGQIDSFAVSQLPLALGSLPPQTSVLIDLATAELMSRAPLADLRRLHDAGVSVTIRGEAAAIGELTAGGLVAGDMCVVV